MFFVHKAWVCPTNKFAVSLSSIVSFSFVTVQKRIKETLSNIYGGFFFAKNFIVNV